MSLLRCLFLVVVTSLTLGACASPLNLDRNAPPELRKLAAAYEVVVREALAAKEPEWVSGWDGNDRIAEEGRDHLKGLCYEWQELVYGRLAPRAKELGWSIAMIAVNESFFSEHHAVLVHAPERGSSVEVLAARDEAAWVFDPWVHGRPEVYSLKSWLAIPWIVFQPARIEVECH